MLQQTHYLFLKLRAKQNIQKRANWDIEVLNNIIDKYALGNFSTKLDDFDRHK